jgi:hypothetical protein
MAEDKEVGVGEVEQEAQAEQAEQAGLEGSPGGGGGGGDAPLGEAEGGASALLGGGDADGLAHASFRTLRTHQRCAPPAPDAPGGVLGFELACCAAGLAAGGYIVWRKRRAARGGGAGTTQRV